MFLDVISLFGTGDMSVSTSKYCEDLKPFGSLVSQGQHVPIGKFSAPVVHAMKPANFTRRDDNHLLSGTCKKHFIYCARVSYSVVHLFEYVVEVMVNLEQMSGTRAAFPAT